MKTKIGILGSGVVAQTLGTGFIKYGFDVMLGTRDTAKLAAWASSTGALTGSFAEAAAFGEIVVLAVKGTMAGSALAMAGKTNLAGKIVIDTTNPIADLPPVNGVLQFFSKLDSSLMENLQEEFPEARLVKAFNSVGNAMMIDPDYGGIKPTMFICGNDPAAKERVASILDRFGWESEDMGSVEAARAIEPLCMLWCIPGFTMNQWGHAFKLLKK
jgi:predicted dinucleotide-binding enzyme